MKYDVVCIFLPHECPQDGSIFDHSRFKLIFMNPINEVSGQIAIFETAGPHVHLAPPSLAIWSRSPHTGCWKPPKHRITRRGTGWTEKLDRVKVALALCSRQQMLKDLKPLVSAVAVLVISGRSERLQNYHCHAGPLPVALLFQTKCIKEHLAA